MSIAPSLFSSAETHCCASKRQKNICCTRGLFLLLDYQVYTCQHCPGISNTLTQEQLQDATEKVKCNHDQLLPETPPCTGVTSPAGCPTLDVQQLLCQLVVKKLTAKFKTFRPAQHSSMHNTLHYWGTTPHSPHAGLCTMWHFPQGNNFLWSCPGREEVSTAARGVQ